MSPLRKQGSRAKKLDSRLRGNDKHCSRNRNYITIKVFKEGCHVNFGNYLRAKVNSIVNYLLETSIVNAQE